MRDVRTGVTAFAALATAAMIAACAAGEEDTLANAPTARREDTASSTPLPPSGSAAAEGDDAGGGPGPATDAGSDAASATDTGTPLSCATATNTCASPIDLGLVRADEGGDVATRSGSATTWFKLRATEGDTGGPGGKRMKIRATVTSQAGANFDVFVHLAGDGSSTNCTTPTASSTTTAASEQAQVEWGETSFFNGDEDDRWINIEVRWVSGTCAAASNFTLTVNRW